MNRFSIYLVCMGFTIFNSCKNKLKVEVDHHVDEVHKHWSYDGETSPEYWAEIEKESDCSGNLQSPINIIDDLSPINSSDVNKFELFYSPKTELSEVINNGHSIEVDFEEGDSLKYKDEVYHLKQIHFHEPSEHTINGVRYPIELHLVHTNKIGEYAVLSIMGEEGVESEFNEFLDLFLPLKKGEKKEFHEALDLTDLFPVNSGYYSYRGSLTTPPCTEKVNWFVFKKSITISEEAIIVLKNNMPLNNYRGEQKLNGREVLLVTNK